MKITQTFARKYASAVSIYVIAVIIFSKMFKIAPLENNLFYDADSGRTLDYLQDPLRSMALMRPLLFPIMAVWHLVQKIISAYPAWLLLNIIATLYLLFYIRPIGKEQKDHFFFYLFFCTSFGILSWTLVPDTFILSVSLYLLATWVMLKKATFFRETAAGILAAGTNIFFLFPWTIFYFWQRKISKWTLLAYSSTVLIVLGSAALTYTVKPDFDWGQPEKTGETVPVAQTGKIVDGNPENYLRIREYLPFFDSKLFGHNIGQFAWIHNPLDGLFHNILSFLTSPWIPTYFYLPSEIGVDSVLIHPLILGVGLIFTCLAFFGYSVLYRVNRRRFHLAISLEFASLLLFVSFSIHPYLFSPLLIIGRFSGLYILLSERRLLQTVALSVNVVMTSYFLIGLNTVVR